jgi:hypothetical protein
VAPANIVLRNICDLLDLAFQLGAANRLEWFSWPTASKGNLAGVP